MSLVLSAFSLLKCLGLSQLRFKSRESKVLEPNGKIWASRHIVFKSYNIPFEEWREGALRRDPVATRVEQEGLETRLAWS